MRFPKVSATNINGLPLGYTEVEYLQSSGTQYIDTGIAGSSTLKIEMIAQKTGSSFGVYFGAGTGNNRIQAVYLNSYNNARIGNINSNLGPDSEKFNVVVDTLNKNVIYNGTSYPFAYTSALTSLNIFIFTRNEGGSYADKATAKCWSFKIWDNDVLIRDYIPCLDSNNRPCMYDRVEGKPYYNLGTGEFTYGKKIYGVEYIESTGTQYIDTGIKLNNNSSVKLDYQLTQAVQSRTGLFGALNMTGSNQGRIGSILSPSNQQLEHGYGAGNDYWQQGKPDTNRHVIYQKKNKIYFDGTLIHTFETATFSLVIDAYLGNFVFTNYTPAKAKYYSSQWWDGDTLIRDYIPVRDENNVGYMFDRVSHTLYTNAGTGSFVVGKDTLGKSKAKLIKTKTTVSGLPYGYTEVEYLESNGNQYIDTGIQPTDTYGYRVRNTYTAGAGEQCAIGSMDSGNRFVGIYTSGSANGISGAWGNYVGFLPSYTWSTGTILDVKGNYKNNRKLIIDSTELKDITDTHISGIIENTVYLFARHYGSTITKMRGRIYSAEITNGQDVIYKFIPALDSSNRPCMYDIIEGKAYYNQGTGEFTYGPKIIPVDYLQSSGTQYIDTGFKPNNNTEYEVSGYMNPSGVFGVARWSGESTYDTFGAHSVTANPLDYYGRYSDNKYYNGPSSAFNNNIIWKHTKNNISITNVDNGTVYVNENITTATFQSTYNMWIFAFNNMGSILARSVGCKIYYFKIWDNGTLIRDYIPVKNENGVGYMFDRISHTLYANAGSGSFVVGDEKILSKVRFIEDTSVISEYTKVKCLISSGTQYIDTGITGNNPNLKIEVDATTYEFGWCHQNNESGSWVDAFSFPSDNKERVNYGNYSLVKDFNYDRTTRKIRTFDFQTGFYIDGVLGQSFTISNYSSLTPSLPLFARYDFNSSSYTILANSSYTIYGCRIWDGINMVRNLIPVLRNSDNKPGMFDRVTKTFFTNQGTGEFTYETL